MATTHAVLFDFDNSYARELPELTVDSQPANVPRPELVAVNRNLAESLGLDPTGLDTPHGAAVLSGDAVPEGSTPVAMAYSGHQFGGFSPMLGDGRAVLLGEILDPDGHRFDVHLKGSGRTPFARGGDGKATIGPMLREFLIAEAMAALGIPTTRALAVATTGEMIRRTRPEPGAVLTRVAASHLRVGTFQYAARVDDPGVVRRLADYAIARHYPEAAAADNPSLALLDAVVDAQAALVAQWMLVGFIHGVMNTDNVTISGEGIDYGPCAFMDRYDPATVFSSIDHGGRYAYQNQPQVTLWNLARFAETLLPLIDPDPDQAVVAATATLDTFQNRYQTYWQAGMAAKLGLAPNPDQSPVEHALFDTYLDLLVQHQVDYTTSFRALAATLRGDRQSADALFGETDTNGDTGPFAEWEKQWRALLGERDLGLIAAEMDQRNPIYIPRNHLVDAALTAATDGDLGPFQQLLDVVTNPFDQRPGLDRYSEPAPVGFDDGFQTFCGT